MAALDASQAHYLSILREQRRLSPLTIQHYARDLAELNTLCQSDAPPRSLTQLDPFLIRRFVGQLHARGRSGRSLARVLSAWRGYFAWLGETGVIRANPCADIRPPRSAKRLPKALSVDQAMQLLNTPDTAASDKAISQQDLARRARDQAMFEMLYSAGLRLSELASLNLDVCHDALGSGEIRVTGKRQKTRVVPLGRAAQAALREWLTFRSCLANPDEPGLFVSQRGNRLSRRMIQQRLTDWSQSHGLETPVHPHMLRHSFASHVLQSSGDLRAVQEMMGHASIASTQVYTHLDFQHLAQIYDQAHPRAKRKE